jgi:hypothetical protein
MRNGNDNGVGGLKLFPVFLDMGGIGKNTNYF